MGLIKKKKEFVSKVPKKYQHLASTNMTEELMEEILRECPYIKTPKYIDSELQKGHISEEKATELKMRSVINGISMYMKKEKEEFENEQKRKLPFINKQNNIKQTMVTVYESGIHGIISKDEVNYLIDVLR